MGVRPAGGKAVNNQRTAVPSANELLRAVSNFSSAPTAASVGEFNDYEIINVVTKQFYNPQSFGESNRRNQAGEAVGTGMGARDSYYIDEDGNYVDRSSYRQSYDIDDDTDELIIPGYKGPQQDESTAPAQLSVVPTSSSNPERPRTVAAGYDRDRGTLTVVFRDGTFYNYYEVSSSEWQDFKRRVSKGQYIYKYLDFKPRGAANVRTIPAGARKIMYGIARASQLKNAGKQYTRKK